LELVPSQRRNSPPRLGAAACAFRQCRCGRSFPPPRRAAPLLRSPAGSAIAQPLQARDRAQAADEEPQAAPKRDAGHRRDRGGDDQASTNQPGTPGSPPDPAQSPRRCPAARTIVRASTSSTRTARKTAMNRLRDPTWGNSSLPKPESPSESNSLLRQLGLTAVFQRRLGVPSGQVCFVTRVGWPPRRTLTGSSRGLSRFFGPFAECSIVRPSCNEAHPTVEVDSVTLRSSTPPASSPPPMHRGES